MASKAIDDVAAERKRQVEGEGWTPEHDDGHTAEELAQAAACYIAPKRIFLNVESESPYFSGNDGGRGDRQLQPGDWVDAWPWGQEWDKRSKHDRRRQLVIGVALALAEIERIDRMDSTPD